MRLLELVLMSALFIGACAKKKEVHEPVGGGGEMKAAEAVDLSDPTLSDEMLSFEPLDPNEFAMQFTVIEEMLGETSLPKMVVANLFQDYTEYEVCKDKQCENAAFNTPEAYLPLNKGRYSIRIRGCLSYGRTTTDEITCGPWSKPVDYEQKSDVPTELLSLIAAFNRANMDVFANGEKTYLSFYDFVEAGAKCETPPYPEGSVDILAASSANAYALALNEGAYPFETYTQEEGLALAGGKTVKGVPFITMLWMLFTMNSLQGTSTLDRASLTPSEKENIKLWQKATDERNLRKARGQLEAKLSKKVETGIKTRLQAQIEVLNQRIGVLVQERLKEIDAKVRVSQALSEVDIDYLNRRAEEIPEGKFKELLAENEKITIGLEVRKIEAMEIPTKADLVRLKAFRTQHPDLVSDDVMPKVEANRQKAVAAQMEAERVNRFKKAQMKLSQQIDVIRRGQLERQELAKRRSEITSAMQEGIDSKRFAELKAAQLKARRTPVPSDAPDTLLEDSQRFKQRSHDLKQKGWGTTLKAAGGVAVLLGATALIGAAVYAAHLSESPTCEAQAVGTFKQAMEGVRTNNDAVLSSREGLMTDLESRGLTLISPHFE